MEKLRKFWKKESVQNAWLILKIAIMIGLIFLYLLFADLSTAPEFIYNQF